MCYCLLLQLIILLVLFKVHYKTSYEYKMKLIRLLFNQKISLWHSSIIVNFNPDKLLWNLLKNWFYYRLVAEWSWRNHFVHFSHVHRKRTSSFQVHKLEQQLICKRFSDERGLVNERPINGFNLKFMLNNYLCMQSKL